MKFQRVVQTPWKANKNSKSLYLAVDPATKTDTSRFTLDLRIFPSGILFIPLEMRFLLHKMLKFITEQIYCVHDVGI